MNILGSVFRRRKLTVNFANVWNHQEIIHTEEYPGLCLQTKKPSHELREPLETSGNNAYSACTVPSPFCLSQRVKFLALELLDEGPGAIY
jgi:hypothetical protein